jgi:DUF4097 and DUF4098 domain-containing protein YvlB
MKKQYTIIGIFIVFIVCVLSGCFGAQSTDYLNEEFEANENTVLNVSTINGQIEIYAWDGETISLNAVKKSSFGQEELDNIEISVLESGDQIEILAVYTGHRTTTPSVDMNIKVPRSVTVQSATTSNGAIQISGIKGDVKATSSNGAIIIENVDGYVSATTSNGRIEVKGTTGIKDLKSSNLGIYAEVFGFQDNVSISTSNGKITVYLNPSLNADIEMTTSNGRITISGLSLDLTVSEEKHKSGKLGVGGKNINITTSNGDIKLLKLDA